MSEISHNIDRTIRYKTDDPIFQIHEYNLDIKAGHIYLFGEESYIGVVEEDEPGVEYSMSNRFIKNLNILSRNSTDDTILIHMKTCGGDWHEGMAMYDAIKACPKHVCILNYTHARSMSSIIFLAADKRVMMPHSRFMFHGGIHGYYGTHKQFQTEAKEGQKAYDTMVEIYVESLKIKGKYSKWSKKRIKDWVQQQMDKKEEVYLDANEAVDLGFADMVFGRDGVYNWSSLCE